jgi:hypothetical protein
MPGMDTRVALFLDTALAEAVAKKVSMGRETARRVSTAGLSLTDEASLGQDPVACS